MRVRSTQIAVVEEAVRGVGLDIVVEIMTVQHFLGVRCEAEVSVSCPWRHSTLLGFLLI